jgi:nucleoid DNA-binding protein
MNKKNTIKTTNGISEIVKAIKENEGCEDISQNDIKAVLDGLKGVIIDKLANDEEVDFVGYFKFSFRNKEAGEMILQFGEKKGKKIKTKAKKIPTCSFGKRVKEGINK